MRSQTTTLPGLEPVWLPIITHEEYQKKRLRFWHYRSISL
jgi:hypothetical protein